MPTMAKDFIRPKMADKTISTTTGVVVGMVELGGPAKRPNHGEVNNLFT